ncbi:MAG: methionine synthase, partial [Sporomusaceae bacterium]|nr:methionine synthase [Sporomusaceae bacterium]
MPIYNPRLLAVDVEETRRYAGLNRSRETFPESLLLEACAKAQLLITPKTTWEMYAYDSAFHTIMADEPLVLTSESIISLLEGAVMAAVLAATVGERLEEEVSDEFTRGSYIKGLLLDAAGTSAVEQACD